MLSLRTRNVLDLPTLTSEQFNDRCRITVQRGCFDPEFITFMSTSTLKFEDAFLYVLDDTLYVSGANESYSLPVADFDLMNWQYNKDTGYLAIGLRPPADFYEYVLISKS